MPRIIACGVTRRERNCRARVAEVSFAGFTCNCRAAGALTFAGLAMRDRSRRISVVTFAAVMTVPSCRKMPALQTNASADTARQLVQLHVESALSRVEVAVAH